MPLSPDQADHLERSAPAVPSPLRHLYAGPPSTSRTYASVAAGPRSTVQDTGGWGFDDVDRQESLDDLQPEQSGSASLSRLDPLPTPPWRRRTEGVIDSLTMSDAAGPSRSRDQPTPTASASARQLDETASSTSSSRGLAPIFTLDELLGAARADAAPTAVPEQNDAANAANRQNRQRPRSENFTLGDPGWTVWDVLRNERLEERAASRRSWQGGLGSARRTGPLQGSGPPAAQDPRDTTLESSMLTSRPRRRILQAHRLATARDSLEGDYGVSAELRGLMDDPDSDDSGDLALSDLLRATGSMPTSESREHRGSGAIVRGRNNRRRRSFLERIEAQELYLPPDRDHPIHPIRVPAMGMEPTNVDTSRMQQPLVVRTSTTRPRSDSDASMETSSRPRALTKRRKVDQRPMSQALTRPTYLDYSTLPASALLPDAFDPPPNRDKSFLALTTTRSPLGQLRHVVTFSDFPYPSRTDADASAVRANRTIPLGCGVHYYEAEVLDQGEEGFMSVGWMQQDLDLGRLVGWDRGSWGWHADDGRSFEGQGRGEEFTEKWGTGDVVGCGVDFTLGRAFFTKNGKLMGHRFKKMGKGLYPAVGLRTQRESLSVNFNGPFRFDVDKYVRDVRDRVWSAAMTTPAPHIVRLVDQPSDTSIHNLPKYEASSGAAGTSASSGSFLDSLPSESSLRDPMQRTTAAFVVDYLQHTGRDRILASVLGDMSRRNWLPPAIEQETIRLSPPNVPSEDLQLRHFSSPFAAIRHVTSVVARGLPAPMKLLYTLDPSLLTDTTEARALWQRIRVRRFVHLLDQSGVDLDEAIAYGKGLMGETREAKWEGKESRMLTEAFGLLGIESGDWTEEIRGVWRVRAEEDAKELEAHLRRVMGIKTRTHLEQAIGQTRLVAKALVENGVADGAFIDVRRAWEDDTASNTESGGDTREGTTTGTSKDGAQDTEQELYEKLFDDSMMAL